MAAKEQSDEELADVGFVEEAGHGLGADDVDEGLGEGDGELVVVAKVDAHRRSVRDEAGGPCHGEERIQGVPAEVGPVPDAVGGVVPGAVDEGPKELRPEAHVRNRDAEAAGAGLQLRRQEAKEEVRLD
eukprot:CAMPEP_0118914670 /NCGR_PEP_ID=MMETSP1166-20130328/14996_1 /TAXON_ID=1104430 /ORGANISM="Chrysoreinhardia sp, Strain CCMP3193" /LENGTH=128 /DNA_ID=CAMNT_0006854277 /DNA_START=90 /DNA_END=474 /DNA_ORIENTATION=+